MKSVLPTSLFSNFREMKLVEKLVVINVLLTSLIVNRDRFKTNMVMVPFTSATVTESEV